MLIEALEVMPSSSFISETDNADKEKRNKLSQVFLRERMRLTEWLQARPSSSNHTSVVPGSRSTD